MSTTSLQRLVDETKKPLVNGNDATTSGDEIPELVSSIPTVPVTFQRKPFAQANNKVSIANAGKQKLQ
jgi:hypothetical protein